MQLVFFSSLQGNLNCLWDLMLLQQSQHWQRHTGSQTMAVLCGQVMHNIMFVSFRTRVYPLNWLCTDVGLNKNYGQQMVIFGIITLIGSERKHKNTGQSIHTGSPSSHSSLIGLGGVLSGSPLVWPSSWYLYLNSIFITI